LSCKHCSIFQSNNLYIKSYGQIKRELEYSYSLGSRFIDFEGGEPTLWNDGNKNLNSLIKLAKSIGFYTTTITTNAQIPFQWVKSDSIWVSLDGIKNYHDNIRGKGSFNRLLKNISTINHSKLNANMVINSQNYNSVEETINFVKNHSRIQSISLNFHIPDVYTKYLLLDWDKRSKIIDLIIHMKKLGYPIMNSISGLKFMKKKFFKKQCWISNFIMPDGTKFSGCQWKNINCNQCGLSMSGEMSAIFNLKLDTILAGIKLRITS
jgi:MoaA/NifB/PqqE/SkfB family radical SAM enzyme